MIAAAVLTSIPLGITTALAVATHEIPQEVGDFAILLHSGYSRSRAPPLNVVSGFGRGRGRCPCCADLRHDPGSFCRILSLAAASFLHCGGRSDSRAPPHGRTPNSFRQIVLIGLGIATMLLCRTSCPHCRTPPPKPDLAEVRRSVTLARHRGWHQL